MGRFLRSKELRRTLWLASDGKCSICGEPLKDDWHADHIIPYSHTKRTNVFEMQATCSACNLRKGATVERLPSWEKYFAIDPLFREQVGQRKAFELAATVEPDDKETISWLFEFVTGYGKTLTAYGVFWILHKRGLVDCLITFVPSDEQRRQFAEDAEDAKRLLGIDVCSWVIEKAPREFRVVRSRECQVFVASYQQLDNGPYFSQLMEFGGKWLVVADECHHLPRGGVWSERLIKLPNVFARIGLSATPARHDFKRLLGVPNDPVLRVTYKQAYEEKVVKRVVARINHYHLKVDIDGKPHNITTEELRLEEVLDFNKYEARRQLRYNPDYLDKMLIEPLQDLAARNARHPGQHQGIAFCMSCRHADYVCGQLNQLSVTLGLGFVAAWIGVGAGNDGKIKSKEENDLISAVFRKGFDELTPDQRNRCIELELPTRVDFLVQVSKAEEGFNSKRASVLVFLNLIESKVKLLQQLGRGLRRNSHIKDHAEDDASIYASADTPLADIVRTMEIESSPNPVRDVDPGRDEGCLRLFDIPPIHLIETEYDRTDYVGPNGVDLLTPDQMVFCEKHNIPPAEYISHFNISVPPVPRTRRPSTPQEKLKAAADQVKRNTSILIGNIARLHGDQNGIDVDAPEFKKVIGHISRSVHLAWIRTSGLSHDQMTSEDFDKKNQWLQEVNSKLKESREVPEWVSFNL